MSLILAAQKTHRVSTRDRILAASLDLFNEKGASRVTTAEIAAASAINEGNLYYHFQRKEKLIETLFERFSGELIAVAEQPLRDPAEPESYVSYQQGWFSLMWRWRFFYRDGAELRGLAPALTARLRGTFARGQAGLRSVLLTMAAHGLLRADPETIEGLIKNSWIVSSHWMEYRSIETGRDLSEADLSWGLNQVRLLYRPHLSDAAYAVLASPRAASP